MAASLAVLSAAAPAAALPRCSPQQQRRGPGSPLLLPSSSSSSSRSSCSLSRPSSLDRHRFFSSSQSRFLASVPRSTPDDGPVVCLGEGLFDLLADQKGLPRDQVTSWTPFPGGAPANVACAVSTLGKRAAFVSALGKDELGDEFLKVLRSKKVDVETEGCVQRVEGRPTRDVYVVYTKSGDREFVGFGEKTPTEGYADCFIDPSKLPTGLISSAGALVTGTLGLAYPQTAEAMRRAVGVARGARVPVIVDVNWRPVFFEKPESEATKDEIREYVLASADVVKLSDEEAEWLFGVKAAEALKDPEEVLRRLLGGGGEKGSGSSSSPSPSSSSVGVLVTGGGLGASYSFLTPEGKNATSGFLPALEVAATDTTGAGDAFLGGFLVSLLDAGGLGALRSDPEKLRGAVAFAAAAGAATTTAPGAIAAQPGREAVERLLNK